MNTPIDRIRENVAIIDDNSLTESDIHDTIERINELHSENALIPIICEDMYEYVNQATGEKQSLQSYIVENVIKKHSKQNKKIELTETELNDIINGGYYGLSLLKEKIGRDIYMDIYGSVVTNGNIRSGITLKEDVKNFLNASHFPLIITTNCFRIIENDLDDDYSSVWYLPNKQNGSKLSNKTVYHLFGQAKLGDYKWGHNEMEILGILKSLFSKDYTPINLTEQIAKNGKKLLLILGNNTPDWLFRFIISPIYGTAADRSKSGYYFDNKHNSISKQLELCLHDFNFDTEIKITEILKGATEAIKSKSIPMDLSGHKKEFDFFLSHSSEDNTLAEKLKELLERKGLKVWYDKKENIDGHYWDKIIDGIKNSAYFIPLVTGSFIKKTESGTIWKELLTKYDNRYLPLDSEEAGALESHLDGVMIELLLADSWREEQHINVFSIPMILKGAEFAELPLDAKKVNQWGEDSKRLPKGLFHTINSYIFDAENKEDGLNWVEYDKNGNIKVSQEFNYDNYKSNKRG